MDGKTTAIVAHVTLIGWIIALIMNNDKKDPLASFYIRQMLGIMLLGLALSFLAFFLGRLGSFLWIITVILWIISLINAVSGKMAPLPVVGQYFQDWFKGI